MPHLITKSLFVDFRTFPKVAWWRWNHLDIYKKIKKLETEEAEEHIIELGKTVEWLVGRYLTQKTGKTIANLFPENPEQDEGRMDDDDTWVELSFADRIEKNIADTELAIKAWEKLIYQPWFLLWDCYVRADYMVRNNSGSYNLYEVKAKSHIRREVTNDGEKEHIGKIEDAFINDVSFQKYVIDEVFGSWGLPPVEKVYIAHLNALYVKRGAINIEEIVQIEEVGNFSQVTVIQGNKWKEKIIDRDDILVSPTVVKENIDIIRRDCILSEEEFGKIYLFSGVKYLEYFGKDKPSGTIYSPRYVRPAAVCDFHYRGITKLEDVTEEEVSQFWERASEFILKYQKTEKTPFIDREEIQSRLSSLHFPICFYDYESVSVPVPLIDGTSPYQQSVVQYSLHKLYEDGSIEHFGALLSEESDICEIIDIPELSEDNNFLAQKNRHVKGRQEDLFELFLSDIGGDREDSSFVVWYEPFENTRNKEIAESYSKFENPFLKINENTFDLYKVFADYCYFDRGFLGSASIKKVLPVLVPTLSYDTLTIGKGDKAMQALEKLLDGSIANEAERIETVKNLLVYCRQDSYAMLAIYGVLLKSLS